MRQADRDWERQADRDWERQRPIQGGWAVIQRKRER